MPRADGLRWPALALLVGLTAGCGQNLETFEPAPLDYTDRAPLTFAVARASVDSAYQPSTQAPYIDHLIAPSLEDATEALLQQRLRASGAGQDRIQAVIIDASVQENPLETKSGISGFFTSEPAAQLLGRVKVRIDRVDPAGEVVNSMSTAASRTRAVPENVAFAERQRILDTFIRELVDDLDAGLEQNIQETFGDLLQP